MAALIRASGGAVAIGIVLLAGACAQPPAARTAPTVVRLDRHAGRRLLSARRRPRARLPAVAPADHLPGHAERPARSPTSRRSSAARRTSGFAFADVAYIAFVGRLGGPSQPFDRLRGIAVLSSRRCTSSSGATRASGTSAICAAAASASARRAAAPRSPPSLILQAFGIDRIGCARRAAASSTTPPTRLVDGHARRDVRQRRSIPAASVTSATRAGARLMPIEGRRSNGCGTTIRSCASTVIPRGTYPGSRDADPHDRRRQPAGLPARSRRGARLRADPAFLRALPSLVVVAGALRLMDLDAGAGDADSAARRRRALLPRAGAVAMMPARSRRGSAGSPAGWPPASALSVALLTWFGYRAIREWQRSATLLVERRAEDGGRSAGDGADPRHARRSQESVLRVAATGTRHARSALRHRRASSPARSRAIPIPSRSSPGAAPTPRRSLMFFTRRSAAGMGCRTTRRPTASRSRSAREPAVAAAICRAHPRRCRARARVLDRSRLRSAASRIRWSPGCSIAIRSASSSRRVRLHRQPGWVAAALFSRADRAGRRGSAAPAPASRSRPRRPRQRRWRRRRRRRTTGRPAAAPFPLMFFDPLLVRARSAGAICRADHWTVQVQRRADPTLAAAIRGADRTLMRRRARRRSSLALGLVLTARAVARQREPRRAAVRFRRRR